MLARTLRILLNASALTRLVERQQQLLNIQEQQLLMLQIENSRWRRDVISNFLIVLDSPDTQEEQRERLREALIDLADEVARLEEHVV